MDINEIEMDYFNIPGCVARTNNSVMTEDVITAALAAGWTPGCGQGLLFIDDQGESRTYKSQKAMEKYWKYMKAVKCHNEYIASLAAEAAIEAQRIEAKRICKERIAAIRNLTGIRTLRVLEQLDEWNIDKNSRLRGIFGGSKYARADDLRDDLIDGLRKLGATKFKEDNDAPRGGKHGWYVVAS